MSGNYHFHIRIPGLEEAQVEWLDDTFKRARVMMYADVAPADAFEEILYKEMSPCNWYTNVDVDGSFTFSVDHEDRSETITALNEILSRFIQEVWHKPIHYQWVIYGTTFGGAVYIDRAGKVTTMDYRTWLEQMLAKNPRDLLALKENPVGPAAENN